MKRTTALALAAAGGLLLWRRARASDDPGILGPEAVRDLYDRLAPVYDAVAAAYDLVGSGRFHRRAVEALGLRPGDTAVDLACGTGVNLPYLVEAVGPTGRVVAVDLSPGMLAQARQRVEEAGWENVELVEADVRDYDFPEPVHGVVSTFGLEMVPEHEDVIARAVAALAPGGRIAVGGLRHPERWPEWAVRLGELVNRPFGVTRAYEDVQPWRSIEAHADGVSYEESLLGAAYLAVGRAPDASPHDA
jgi:demethylmenaquinone methyltransferase/2-methoxy-6-polyprenyl-1,4-benzoquinol methylase